MALRYRVERAQNGDILDPSPWNLNQTQFVGEFSGYLDHDNLPTNSVDGDSVVVGAFTQEVGDVTTSTLTLDTTSTDWQVVHALDIDADVDTVVLIEWSGGHKWNQASGGRSNDGVSSDMITYQISVDGNVIAETGPMGDDQYWGCADLVGVTTLQAGPHTISVFAKIANMYIRYDTGQLWSYFSGVKNGVVLQSRELIATELLR